MSGPLGCGPDYGDHDWVQNASPSWCRACRMEYPTWRDAARAAAPVVPPSPDQVAGLDKLEVAFRDIETGLGDESHVAAVIARYRAAAPPVERPEGACASWPFCPRKGAVPPSDPVAGLREALRYLRGLSDDLADAVLSGVRLDDISDGDWDAATEGLAALLDSTEPDGLDVERLAMALQSTILTAQDKYLGPGMGAYRTPWIDLTEQQRRHVLTDAEALAIEYARIREREA